MIFRKILKEDLEYILQWLDPNDYLRQGALERYASEGRAYTVEIDGKPVAVGIIHAVDREGAWLMGARVIKEHRGRGIGRHLTQGLVDEAIRAGYRWAALLTSIDNEPVHRICRGLGFEARSLVSWLSIDRDKIYRFGEGGMYTLIPGTDRRVLDKLHKILGSSGLSIPDGDNTWAWRPPSREAVEKLIRSSKSICLAGDEDHVSIAFIGSRRGIGEAQAIVFEAGPSTEDHVKGIARCIAEEAEINRFEELEIVVVGRPRLGASAWEKIYSTARDKPWRAYVFHKDL